MVINQIPKKRSLQVKCSKWVKKVLIFCFIGFLLCGLAIYIYPFRKREMKQIPSGITILITGSYPKSLERFIYAVFNISPSDSSADCELFVELVFRESPRNNDTLIFVVPYRVDNCKVLFPPNSIQPSVYYREALDCSYISIPLSSEEEIFLFLRFRWRNCLRWISYDTFDVIVPLGISDIEVIKPNWPSRTIDPSDFSYLQVSISDPPECKPLLYNPPVSKVHTFEGRICNSWIIDTKIGSPLASVRASYVSERLADEKDFRLFVSGALFGTGISVLTSLFLSLGEKPSK